MLEIPGIDPDKVERYGKPFLEMIKNSQQLYESMMRQQEDRTQDPNHINVINISDDEEFENHDLDDFDENDTLQERSTYFPDRDVEAFNAKSKLVLYQIAEFHLMETTVSQLQSLRLPPSQSGSRDEKDKRSNNHKGGGRGGAYAAGGFKKKYRKSSNSSNKTGAASGGTKKRSSGGKSSKANAQTGGGGRIGMMPT